MNSKKMPFLEHLKELRGHLISCAIALGAGFILCSFFASSLFDLLLLPGEDLFQSIKGEKIGTGPAEAFMVKLKTAFFAGLILSAPWCFLRLWLFISPGLYEREKSGLLPFVCSSSLAFLLGTVFCYKIVLPFAFDFFLSEYLSLSIAPKIKISEYLSFVCRMLIVFGLVFQSPILSWLMGKAGIISSTWLIKKLRIAVVLIFILSAIITPPDVVTQFLLAGPLLLLYFACIQTVKFVENKRGRGT